MLAMNSRTATVPSQRAPNMVPPALLDMSLRAAREKDFSVAAMSARFWCRVLRVNATLSIPYSTERVVS